MTAIAELNIIPVRNGSTSGEIAKAVEALEAFDVTYEATPMGAIMEADDVYCPQRRKRHTGRSSESVVQLSLEEDSRRHNSRLSL